VNGYNVDTELRDEQTVRNIFTFAEVKLYQQSGFLKDYFRTKLVKFQEAHKGC
jgi:hypothetical protein